MTGTIDWGVLAAWAQAVLTAAAVFLAAWLQDRSIRRREAAELRRQLDALGGLLGTARSEIDRARGVLLRLPAMDNSKALAQWQGGPFANVALPDVATIRQVLQALGDVRLHELPSWVLAQATLTLRQLLAEVETQTGVILSRAAAGGPADANVLANPLAALVVTANTAIEVFEAEREAAAEGCGGLG